VQSPRLLLLVAVAAVVATALTGCGSSSTPQAAAATPSASSAPTTPSSTAPSSSASSAAASSTDGASPSASPTNPYGTMSVDPPGPNDPVLTVTGGSAGPTSFTLAQLEELGTTAVALDEPFVKRRLAFTGVPMSAVLDKAGIPAGATITTKALNDYEYANLASALTGSQALIATRRGEGPVPFDAGGPIRIVFPDSSPLSTTLDAWNWSMSSIRVTAGG